MSGRPIKRTLRDMPRSTAPGPTRDFSGFSGQRDETQQSAVTSSVEDVMALDAGHQDVRRGDDGQVDAGHHDTAYDTGRGAVGFNVIRSRLQSLTTTSPLQAVRHKTATPY